jgi:hypothetical protein
MGANSFALKQPVPDDYNKVYGTFPDVENHREYHILELNPDDEVDDETFCEPDDETFAGSVLDLPPTVFRNYYFTARELADKPRGNAPFSYLMFGTSGNACVAVLLKDGRPIARVKINPSDDYHNKWGNRKFLDTLTDIMNGQRRENSLRHHDPGQFGFKIGEKRGEYRVERGEMRYDFCEIKTEGVQKAVAVLQKAMPRALVAVGLEEWPEGIKPPCRTRLKNTNNFKEEARL